MITTSPINQTLCPRGGGGGNDIKKTRTRCAKKDVEIGLQMENTTVEIHFPPDIVFSEATKHSINGRSFDG